jgi:hypothetical protein
LLVSFVASAVGGALYSWYSHKNSPSTLNPYSFSPYKLTSKRKISSTSSIFTLESCVPIIEDDNVLKHVWKKAIWSIQVKQPQLQIARAYTPLPPSIDGTQDEIDEYTSANRFRCLIRQEEGGEVSTFLHRLPEQSTVEIRGPNLEFLIPQDIREIVFLAGGTGIAPAMQVAHALQDRSGVKLSILWANRKREDCEGGLNDSQMEPVSARFSRWKNLFGLRETPIVQDFGQQNLPTGRIVYELEQLKRKFRDTVGSQMEVQYFVDGEKTFIQPSCVQKLLQHSDHSKESELPGTRIVLISGPDGFVKYFAGSKIWNAGREEQGCLGGVLEQLNTTGWKIWKL